MEERERKHGGEAEPKQLRCKLKKQTWNERSHLALAHLYFLHTVNLIISKGKFTFAFSRSVFKQLAQAEMSLSASCGSVSQKRTLSSLLGEWKLLWIILSS